MRTIILFLTAWLLCCSLGQAQQLTAAEYFLDADPGLGAGTPIGVSTGNVVNANFAVNTTGIPVGFHTLSTRFKDAAGTWGIAAARLFYIYGASGGSGGGPAPDLAAGEYFIDVDPGVGQGQSFAVTPGAQASAAFAVNTSGLPVGFHSLSMRFKDVNGLWGMTAARLFYIYGASGGSGGGPAPDLAAGEYFIDVDPGVGQGQSFGITTGPQASAAFAVDASALPIGFHNLSMRFKDVNGLWGMTEARLFYVYGGNGGSTTPASPIVASEYFFDADPGVGNGTALPTGAPQDNVSVNTAIDASALAIGAHVLTIRMKDADGRWGIAESRPFVVLEAGALQNDECLAATPLTLHPFGACPANGTAGSTEEATSSNATQCWGSEYPDVWYTVNSGSSPQVTIDLTEVSAADVRIEVATSCGGAVTECISYYPYTFNTSLNTTYWLRVYAVGTAGSFGICASAAAEDCLGVIGGTSTQGTLCDDGVASTINDQYQADCECHGWDCAGVLGGTAGPGTPCNYYTTNDGVWDASCSCTYPQDCEGVPGGPALPGTSCDDGLASTTDDAWTVACACVGHDCLGMEGGSTGPGSPCPEGWYPVGAVDPVLGADCQCNWTDCLGIVNGTAVPGATCDDGLSSTGNDVWNASCQCIGEEIDCYGNIGGTAYLDNCATCVGGNTGLSPCTADCNGVFGGTAFVDNCSVCVGGNTGLTACTTDCNGIFGGTAFIDLCGTCVGGDTGNEPCLPPSNDVCGGATDIAILTNGSCPGNGTQSTTLGASRDGVANASCEANYPTLGFGPDVWYSFNAGSHTSVLLSLNAGSATGLAWEMYAGTCPSFVGNQGCGSAGTDQNVPVTPGQSYSIRVASGLSISARGTFSICLQGQPLPLDCNGEQGGTAYLDNCSTCVGGNTGLEPCTADCNGVFGGTAYLDNCSICVGGNTGITPCAADCNGDLGGTASIDNCGVCVGGNTGLSACVQDCNNVYGGTAAIDACSVCSGGNTGITPNSSCSDCAGVPNGSSVLDACGTCLLPSDPNFQTAVRTLTFTGNGNFQNAVLFPQTGEPSSTYTAEVIYTDSENGQLPLGYPRLILDYEGDGVFNGPLDRTVLMVAADPSDVTTTDGKRYRCTVVSLPAGTDYQTRVQVANGQCLTESGLYNYPDVLVAPDLEIFANDIHFSDPHPAINTPITVYAKVHNSSDFAAEGFVVHLVNEFAPGTVYPDITVNSLAAHDTLTVSWNITTPNVVAWCPMRVIVDATNVITETDELNNNAVRPFVNGDYNVPGSIHVYASVDPAVSEIYSPSDTVVVSGYAYYSGTAVPLADSSVAGATVTINGHYGETYIALTNSQGYFHRGILAPDTPGLYEVTGEVTDYTLTGTVNAPYERVQGCLAGFGVGVSIDQVMFINGYPVTAILTGGSISGNITVYNSTCADVNVPTRLDVGQTGGLPIIADVMVPPLAAGASFTLPFSGIVFDTPGQYSICGTTDADHVLNDLNYHVSDCRSLTVFPALPDIVPYYTGGIGEGVPQCSAGEPGFIVQNFGAVPTGPFTCNVSVYKDGSFVQTFAQAITDIAAFSNLDFSIPYIPPAVGNYSFTLSCDVPLPNGNVVELNEDNNSISYLGSTVACQADLFVEFPCDNPVTPVDPAFPGTATYHAVVTNGGNAVAQGPIDVRFDVSTGGTYSVQYPGDLAPGESASVQVSAPTVAPVTASLTATVDPLNTIPEFNEGGSATDQLCHDYYPTLCDNYWGWPVLPVLGQTTPVSVVLGKDNLYTASFVKVRFEVSGPDIPGTALLGDVMVDPAQARCYICGVGVTLPGSFLFSSEGTYHFTFTVDPDNVYAECDEGNNVLTRDVVITNLPDLRILSQYINPSLLNPDVNEPITLDVTYENIGYGNLGSTFDLKVIADNTELATVANVPGLVTGGTNTVTIPVPFSSPLVGVHVFRAIIDAGDVVVEGDELNNEATRAIVVGAAANLYFGNFSASTMNPYIGQFMTFNGSVSNNGDLPISADVQLYYVNAANDTIPFNIPLHINVDSSATVYIGSYWTVTELPRAIIARIINGSLLEFTYSDNEARIPMGAITAQLTSVPGCAEGPLGSLTVQAFGGVGPYTYAWNNDSTGVVLNAVPGSYSVTITDAEGRTTTANGTIGVAPGCGQVLDCNGVLGGTASIDNCGVCAGGNTGITPCAADCNGVFGGTASLDNCGVCAGGNTGITPCAADCNGVFGGTASLDNCGVCTGGNTGITPCAADCNGVFGGTASLDNCGVCSGGNTGITSCVADCNGVFGGTASLDNCGVCAGGNTGIMPCVADCNGDFGGTASLDNCGVCAGGNTGIMPCVADCNGDFGGTASLDNCGVCAGGNTGITPCAADCNGVFGGTASLDNCGVCAGGNTGITPCAADCNGVFGGTASLDNCGVCAGGNTGITPCVADCNGVFGGTASLDNCGVCAGGNTGVTPCVADCNGVFGGTALLDNCGVCAGGNTGVTACVQDCNGVYGGTALPGTACNDGNAATQNDTYGSDCVCAGTPIMGCDYQAVLRIQTDGHADQTSWAVHDAQGHPVASGGPYMAAQNNSQIDENLCLISAFGDCYSLTIYDSFGDGLSGMGNWQIRSTNGKVLLADAFPTGYVSPSSIPANPSYTAHSFCLPAGNTHIAAKSCGIFNFTPNSNVYCTNAPGATSNQFEFSDPDAGFIRRITVNTNKVRFNQMVTSPLTPGVKYFVRARSNAAGAIADAHFGGGCEVGMSLSTAVTCTQLISAPTYGHSCNESRAFNTTNSFIYATPVVGATEYQFRITIPSENYDQTFIRSTYILQLKWNAAVAPPLVNGYTYNVQVNVKVGTLYSGFCGDVCTITIDNSANRPEASVEHANGTAILWPNPVRESQVNLSIDGMKDADQQITVDIQDIYGKQVFAKEFGNSGERFSTILDLPGDIASGVYMVNITVNGERSVQRLSIMK